MSQNSLVKFESKNARLTITIQRPEALNALNHEVLDELEDILLEEFDPAEHRIVILQGSGEKAFVAGADIAEMSDLEPDDAKTFAEVGQSIGNILMTLPAVTIAKVRGFALGGGCELAMSCDLVIAAKSARFGQPEVNLGLVAGFGGTQRLIRRVGPHLALDMLLTGRGRTITGEEAFQVGLCSRVVDDDKLDAEIEKVCDAVLKTGRVAVMETKRLVYESQNMNLSAGLNAESSAFGLCFTREEAKEGMDAFLKKRQPRFD